MIYLGMAVPAGLSDGAVVSMHMRGGKDSALSTELQPLFPAARDVEMLVDSFRHGLTLVPPFSHA